MKISTDYIISGIICVAILIGVVVFWFFFLRQTPISANGGSDGTVIVNPKEYTNKFPIIFVYDGYSNKKDALVSVALFKETLKIVEPYKSMQNLIITKTFSTDGAYCVPQNMSGEKRIKCANNVFDAVNKLGIPHYKTVILSPLNFAPNSDFARGKNSAIYISTYKGKLTSDQFKRWMGIVFSQELGHSLGLSYEYFYSKPSSFKETSAAAPPNCAPDLATAKTWWKDYNNKGYFKGCSGGDNYIYPEKNTLMSDLPQKQSYGAVSTDYLRGVLSCFYGGEQSITFPVGQTATYSAQLSSCDAFKKNYPDFWVE